MKSNSLLLYVLLIVLMTGCDTPAGSSKNDEVPKVATVPVSSDLVGTWAFSYGTINVNDDVWVFNDDHSFYYRNYNHGTTQYSYGKGTWSIDTTGIFIAAQTHKSPTTTVISDMDALDDWTENSKTFSAHALQYDHNLFFGTYFGNAMGIMTRVGTGTGLAGAWSYISVDGLIKIDEIFGAQTFTVTRYTRTAISGDGSTWIMDETDGVPGPISGGTYEVSGSMVTLVVPSGYQAPAGTYTQLMAISEPYLLGSNVLNAGMIKQ